MHSPKKILNVQEEYFSQVVKDYSHPEVKKQQDEDKKLRLQVRML